MKKISWILIILIFCISVGIWYYFNVFSRTSAVVQIIQIKDHQIKIQFENGSEQLIEAQKIVIPLLKENQQYFIVFYQNKLRAPFLVHIEPNEV